MLNIFVFMGILAASAICSSAALAESCQRDQTSPAHLANFKTTDAANSARGAAIFLVQDPTATDGHFERKVVVYDIGYAEAVKRGAHSMAFKWIPYTEMPKEKIEGAMRAAEKCGQWCGPDRDWCPGLCFCGSGNYCR